MKKASKQIELKHLCCKQRRCTPETCAELPAGKTCADCVYALACERGDKKHGLQTACDWFPRNFADKDQRQAGIDAACEYLVKHGYAMAQPGPHAAATAGMAPAGRDAGYDVDAFSRAVCPRCFAFRGVRIGMRREGDGLICLACGLAVLAAQVDAELLAALDGLVKRTLITAEQAEAAKRRIGGEAPHGATTNGGEA